MSSIRRVSFYFINSICLQCGTVTIYDFCVSRCCEFNGRIDWISPHFIIALETCFDKSNRWERWEMCLGRRELRHFYSNYGKSPLFGIYVLNFSPIYLLLKHIHMYGICSSKIFHLGSFFSLIRCRFVFASADATGALR